MSLRNARELRPIPPESTLGLPGSAGCTGTSSGSQARPPASRIARDRAGRDSGRSPPTRPPGAADRGACGRRRSGPPRRTGNRPAGAGSPPAPARERCGRGDPGRERFPRSARPSRGSAGIRAGSPSSRKRPRQSSEAPCCSRRSDAPRGGGSLRSRHPDRENPCRPPTWGSPRDPPRERARNRDRPRPRGIPISPTRSPRGE